MTTTHQQHPALRNSLPADVRRQLQKMLNGHTTYGDLAALDLCLRRKNLIWPTLRCLHHWGAPPDLQQMCIRHFWKDEDHNRVILNSDGFTLESARELFRKAKFPPLPKLGPIIQVWRGTAGRTKAVACEGLSWTRNRDAACWFATMRGEGKAGTPLVVTAHVQPDQILFLDDEKDGTYEQEVILDRIDGAEIDGAEPEWRVRAKHFTERRKAAQLRDALIIG